MSSPSLATQCDPQPSPVPQGTVGTFEGAYYPYIVPISQVTITVRTGDKDIHQNDRVFLGFAGREFRCRLQNDNNANPFHRRNQMVTLIFGAASNVEDSQVNDPRDPVIDIADVTSFPVYIRTEPNIRKDWEIVNARVETSPSTKVFSLKYPRIILSDDSGEKVDLV